MNNLELSFTFLDKGSFVDVGLNEITREKSERLNQDFISHKNKNKWNLLYFTN